MKSICLTFIMIFTFSFSYAQETTFDKYGFFHPFNTKSSDRYIKEFKVQMSKKYKLKFKKYINTVEIKPSFFNANNLNKFIVLPLIGDKFKDADFAFIAHTLSSTKLKFIDPSLTHTKKIIMRRDEFEFPYEDVERYKFSRPLNVRLAREGKKSKQVLITSKIDHDGHCNFTRYYPVFKQTINNVSKNEIALLVWGLNPKQNIKIAKVKNKGIFGLSFWIADLNEDGVPDLIWGLDPGKGYTAYYKKYFSAFNLNGKWIIWQLEDSSYWDTGC